MLWWYYTNIDKEEAFLNKEVTKHVNLKRLLSEETKMITSE